MAKSYDSFCDIFEMMTDLARYLKPDHGIFFFSLCERIPVAYSRLAEL